MANSNTTSRDDQHDRDAEYFRQSLLRSYARMIAAHDAAERRLRRRTVHRKWPRGLRRRQVRHLMRQGVGLPAVAAAMGMTVREVEALMTES